VASKPKREPKTVERPIPHETILIASSDASQVNHLQRELRSSGYQLLTALAAEQASALLAGEIVQLAIVIIHHSTEHLDKPGLALAEPASGKLALAGPQEREEGYALCQAVKSAAEPRGVPVLLIGSVWARDIVAGALETGADYFLFAPYQEEDLQRAIRGALLNGPSPEPAQVLPGVEVIHRDRQFAVTAGRHRLARLCLSVWEELRQSRAALSWNQAEAQELRRQLRQERQQARLAMIVPEVVQGIAHDFANLLETISAAATVLRSGPAEPAPYRAALDAALTQAGTLIAALQNRSEWDDEEAEAEAVDTTEVVEKIIEAALLPLRAPNIRVRLRVQDLPPIWTNPALLFRSLNNLVWNAVQAMPAGGLLSILGYLHKGRVVLEINDTGVGIAEADQPNIFEPHFTTKFGHSGFGLHLVRNLVRRGGGEITFASRPGRGSTFLLSFPVAPSEQAAEKPARGTSGKMAAP